MKPKLLVLLILFVVTPAVGQTPLTMELKTDKESYDYGETMLVNLTLTNKADSSYSLWGSSSCIVLMGFNEVNFMVECTADHVEYRFPPGQSKNWFWRLNPPELGIPDQEGTQTIHGWGAGMADSIQIQAPKFYGGILSVGINENVPEEELDSLRNRINVEVIWESQSNRIRRYETWKVSGHSIDSISTAHQDDDRFFLMEPYRPLEYDWEVSANTLLESEIPTGYSLVQNYPNPFNPKTTITYSVPEQQQVLLEVFDMVGRKVGTLVDEFQQPGTYQIIWDATSISSGTYIYRITAGSFIKSRTMMLIK